jgi:hypothetical protein
VTAKLPTPIACGKCKRPLADGAAVTRLRIAVPVAPFVLRWRMHVLCKRCSPKRDYENGKCEGCARLVRMVRNRRRRRHVFCSEACEVNVQSARARTARAEVRGASKPCQLCGEHFEPTRKDSCYCSSACRQKAYRRRVTDNDCLSGQTIASRNAREGHAI